MKSFGTLPKYNSLLFTTKVGVDNPLKIYHLVIGFCKKFAYQSKMVIIYLWPRFGWSVKKSHWLKQQSGITQLLPSYLVTGMEWARSSQDQMYQSQLGATKAMLAQMNLICTCLTQLTWHHFLFFVCYNCNKGH